MLSIIVPVFNAKAYLPMCLDSLVNQTLENIEILCVNDCSTDNSLSILQKYAKKDKRIVIINLQKNGGASAARNAGFIHAKGNYIGFVDSDDRIDLNFFETLYNVAEKTKAEIVKGGLKNASIDSDVFYDISLNSKIKMHKAYFTSQFYSAIYKVSFLNKNKFKFKMGVAPIEDQVFLLEVIAAAKNIELVDNVFYYYLNNSSSIISTLTIEKQNSWLKGLSFCLAFLNRRILQNKIDRNFYKIRYREYFNEMLSLLTRINSAQQKKKIAKRVYKYFNLCKNKTFCVQTSLLKFLQTKTINEFLELFKNSTGYADCIFPEIKINSNILKNKKLYIFGTGRYSIKAVEQIKEKSWILEGFLDSNSNINKFLGYKVFRPKEIVKNKKRDFFVIISSRAYALEMHTYLEQAGLVRDKDFFSLV
ncbi:MAG: glycosyltransferase [Fibromonadaceae bacterium]|jgi:glycosyltransferase involved in cell wall biosynthesis|nr:glycosyltransferase [Fibromonadaceae bacterium]